MADTLIRRIRRRVVPRALRGKPFRLLRRAFYQRVYRYPHRNLLVIGQQKSGSTWLQRMLCEIPGYMRWTPGNIKFRRADLRRADFEPPPAGYTVTKVHTPPTPANLQAVHGIGRPYVVLVRDLRDICVSWSFYIHIEPDHPLHAETSRLSIPETIDYFIRERLPDYVFWQLGWQRNLHPDLGLIVRYEDLLADPVTGLTAVCDHFELDVPPADLQRIVDKHAFERTTGRKPGAADATSFNRKGIAGDWRNHFAETQMRAFTEVAGEALGAFGYL